MLLAQNMITKRGTPNKVFYLFQKDFDKWKLLPKGARSHRVTKGGNKSLPKGVIRGVPKGAHTKDTITKENIQKKERLDKLKDDLIKKMIIK